MASMFFQQADPLRGLVSKKMGFWFGVVWGLGFWGFKVYALEGLKCSMPVHIVVSSFNTAPGCLCVLLFRQELMMRFRNTKPYTVTPNPKH